MIRCRARHFVWSLPLVMSIASCVPPQGARYPTGPQPPQAPGAPRFVGTLEGITGPEAFYIRANAATARAHNGLAVYEGDHIYTGSGTRMILRFAQGGEAELDENTDPVPRFLVDLGCLVVDLLRTGRIFVDGSAVCVGAVGTLTRQDSQVVYDVRPGYAQITVAGGRAELRRPRAETVPAGWRVDATARAVMSNNGRPYQLTRAQVEESVRWTRWYQRRQPALPGLGAPGVPRSPGIGRERGGQTDTPSAPPPASAATPPSTAPQGTPGVQLPERNFQRYRDVRKPPPQEVIH